MPLTSPSKFLIRLIRFILPRERLVRHGHGPREELSLKRALRAAWRMIVGALFYVAPGIGYLLWGGGSPFVEYVSEHLAILLMPVLPLVAVLLYVFNNYRRVHPPKPPKGRQARPPKPALPSARQHTRDINDIIANLDHWPLRLIYLLLIGGAIWVTGTEYSVSVETIAQAGDNPELVVVPVLAPLVAFFVQRMRTSFVIARRYEEIDDCYRIANATLGYRSKLPSHPTGRQIAEMTPWLAVEVKKWWALYEIDRAFVHAPENLSTSTLDVWDEFSENLNVKLPRPEEWRIQRDVKGRGARIGPANYPRAILWDGEYDPDPLTFNLGDDLEDGEPYKITFNDTSPHAAVSGGTSSGKTSGAEIIAAQVLLKPMPWDSSLHGQVHILDPKGPFAQRWWGRPGVVVSNGQQNSGVEPDVYDEEGNVVCENTGVMVMAEHMQHIEDEHQRRANVLATYSDVATWVDLPDDVKREEKFFPILVIADEFLDHTSGMKGSGARVEMENEAREFIVTMTDWLLRKARNVGIHIIVIAQRANMKLIGDTMMTNMQVRLITGQIDKSQLNSMFAVPATDVPRLPSRYRDPETGKAKSVPGRARILRALGQPISKIQIMWFGGSTNSGTLDKWLPRGERPSNGDFSLPTGTRLRTKDDFDEEGNLVGEAAAASPSAEPEGDESQDVEARSVEEPAEDEPAPRVPEEPEAPQGPGPEPEDDWEPLAEDDEDGEDPEGDVGTHGQDIFPAATTTEDTCTTCQAPPAWSCPECQELYCADHGERTRNPNPDAAGRFICGSCAARSPYEQVGMAELLADTITKARRYRVPYEHSVREDDDGLYGRLELRAEESGKKIVEVTTRPNPGSADGGFTYIARSSSGTVEGLHEVTDRIDTALSTFVRSRAEPEPTTSEGKA